jgi:Ca2+-binding RTX toxin-like protein
MTSFTPGEDTTSCSAQAGADIIWGESGADTILDGEGPDITYGGPGADANWRESPVYPHFPFTGNGSDVFFGGVLGQTALSTVPGADLVDMGRGDDSATEFFGSGDDTYLGRAGADRLFLGGGADDLFNGGPGVDWVKMASSWKFGIPGPAVVINLTTGLITGRANDTVVGVRECRGNGFRGRHPDR